MNHLRNLLVGSSLAAVILLSGCQKQKTAAENPAADKPTAPPAADSKAPAQDSLEARVDKHGEEVMASTAKAEARQWMKQPKHVFFKADAKSVSQFVEAFYGAGATQVFIADIEEHEGVQYGEALLVVLPTDAPARTKLFEIGTRADTFFQNDETSDKGQKYLYYSLD